MESDLVETRFCELRGPFSPERDAGVHMQMERGAELLLESSNPLKRPLSSHQRVASGNPGTCGPHRSSLFDNRVEIFAATLVGKHVVDISTGLGKRTVVASPVAVTSDE